MKIKSSQLHHRKQNVFENLVIDSNILNEILMDMKENAGELSPLLHWHLVPKNSKESELSIPDKNVIDRYDEFAKEYKTAETMLDVWIGCEGLKNINSSLHAKELSMLRKIDRLNLLEGILNNAEIDWRMADLGSVVELNVISSYLDRPSDTKYILEVGGGMGG